MAAKDSVALAQRWRKTFRALEGALRVSYLRLEVKAHPFENVAEALDLVSAAAEQAEPLARELLVGVVDLLAEKEQVSFAQHLREEAAGRSLLALGRLLRRPLAAPSLFPQVLPGESRIPDYGAGRTLTLGERKALARRPTRKAMDKLFSDPHPAVIRTLLENPKVIEDDVVRLAARRPGNPEVLAEVVRSPRWAHRLRVRMAMVLNPDTPLELATPLVALLVRSELAQVIHATPLAPTLRAVARDLLARRPPVRTSAARTRLQ